MTIYLADRRTGGDRPAEVITTTLNGVAFRAGRRTAAHLAWTDTFLRSNGCWLRIIQPCYNSSVAASAGTHDFDGCLDVEVEDENWLTGQELLRMAGWAAWYRRATPGLWGDHIHMVSLGCPGPVGIYVPGQVDDYYRHALGLKGEHDSGDDPSWHPADIDSTIFDYEGLTDMTPEQAKQLDDLTEAVDVLGAKVESALDRITKAKREILATIAEANKRVGK